MEAVTDKTPLIQPVESVDQEALPGEVVCVLLCFLPLRARSRCALISKAWRKRAWAYLTRLEWVRQTDVETNLDLLLENFHAQMSHLREIYFDQSYLITQPIDHLTRPTLASLRKLRLHTTAPVYYVLRVIADKSLPLSELTLVQQGEAELYPAYENSQIESACALFSHLGETLTHLNLMWSHLPPREADANFIQVIASSFPKLKSLIIAANDWKALRSLEDLEELYICTNQGANLDLVQVTTQEPLRQSIQTLLDLNPPKVGIRLNLFTSPGGYVLNLMNQCLHNAPESLDLILENGFDLYSKCYQRDEKMTYNFKSWAHRDAPAVVVSKAVDQNRVFDNEGKSIFQHLIDSYHIQPEALQSVFEGPFRTAKEIWPVDRLISPVLDKYPSPQLVSAIIGDWDTFGDPNRFVFRGDGNNLLAMSLNRDELQMRLPYLNWRQLNHNGLNTVDYFASIGQGQLVAALMDSISNDEFLEVCSPLTFGSMTSYCEDHLHRLIALAPCMELWKPCVEAAVEIAIRSGHGTNSFFPDIYEEGDPVIREIQLGVLLKPTDEAFLDQFQLNLRKGSLVDLVLATITTPGLDSLSGQIKRLLPNGPAKTQLLWQLQQHNPGEQA